MRPNKPPFKDAAGGWPFAIARRHNVLVLKEKHLGVMTMCLHTRGFSAFADLGRG